MAKKKKTALIIILIVLGLIVAGVLACGALAWWGGGLFLGEYEKVQDELILNACYELEDQSDYTQTDYEQIFSEDFKSVVSYEQSQQVLDNAIPKGGCEQFDIDNFIDMFRNGLAFEISTTNGVTTATLTFESENGQSAWYLIKENNEWKVDDIAVN